MLSIAFTDLWPGFDPENEWFVRQLRTRFVFCVTDSPADAHLVIASVFGQDHQRFDCTRVLLCWENRVWQRARFDWAFTSDYHPSDRHHRIPLWAVHLALNPERVPDDPYGVLRNKTRFAATVVSNAEGIVRNRLHDQLDAYKPVASGGRYRNNVGGPVTDKLKFLRTAKFSIACENSSHPGYTTEKLVHALAADTVPIYWGDPRVGEEFNARRFVNCHDYASEQAVIDRVIEIDNDDVAYADMLSQPWLRNGEMPPAADPTTMLDHFQRILDWRGKPVASRSGLGVAALRLGDRYRARRRYRARTT